MPILNQMAKPSTVTLNQIADEMIKHRINTSGKFFRFTYSIIIYFFPLYD